MPGAGRRRLRLLVQGIRLRVWGIHLPVGIHLRLAGMRALPARPQSVIRRGRPGIRLRVRGTRGQPARPRLVIRRLRVIRLVRAAIRPARRETRPTQVARPARLATRPVLVAAPPARPAIPQVVRRRRKVLLLKGVRSATPAQRRPPRWRSRTPPNPLHRATALRPTRTMLPPHHRTQTPVRTQRAHRPTHRRRSRIRLPRIPLRPSPVRTPPHRIRRRQARTITRPPGPTPTRTHRTPPPLRTPPPHPWTCHR
ncbi:hypothetical protein FNL39_101653 [Nocardia caishijiensis]|uniref:Uncharacterized protein n=1 Tax=Nocardia caishijiensis TaxID=184756 RepID=A0ABQ6YU45_9NOCA|nr:hypothetical protein FNL39_101653 [Nocardia caishijiensis]